MTIGVTLNDKHCYDDYGMWLVNVDISQPEVQTHYVQVPGRTGELDLTEALTGDVRYYNGTLSMTFQTTEKVCGHSWLDQLQRIKTDFHGIKTEAMFDDSDILYSGRCEVSGTPVAGGIFEITIDMNVDTYEEKVYDHYFAVYCKTDGSLTFYGDDELPSGTYKGKTVTTVYDGADKTTTSTSSIPWYGDRENFKSIRIHASFAGARPTRLYYYFYGFTNCTEIEGLGHLNTESVTTMSYMFYNCSQVTSLNVSGFDTSKVTTMAYMFSYCSAVTSLNVTHFDTSNVTSMGYMFRGCSALTSLNLTHFDTAKVTNMTYMFQNCSALGGLNLSNFNTANVTSMTYMFYQCAGLTEIDISMLDTAKVTNMSYMFYNCTSLSEIDVSMLDTAKVTNMGQMFYGCANLVTIYSDDEAFVTTAVTSGSNMFHSCTNLVGGNGTTYNSSNVTYTYAHVDTASNPGYFTSIEDK